MRGPVGTSIELTVRRKNVKKPIEFKIIRKIIEIKSVNSEILVTELKKLGLNGCRIEGRDSNDWKLVDAHDVIIHIFHPEKREFYDLEKMWSEEIPKEKAML